MEVYSIIKNLDEGLLKGQLPALYDGFFRNKGLLIKYSQQFKNSSSTMFIRKVRLFLKQQKKQEKGRNSLPATFKSEGFEQNQTGRDNYSCFSRRFQVGAMIKKKFRKSSLTGIINLQSPQKMLNSSKLAKVYRGGQEQLSWKPNIVLLGEDITAYHEKIREAIQKRSKKPRIPLNQINANSNEQKHFLNYTLSCYPHRYRM